MVICKTRVIGRRELVSITGSLNKKEALYFHTRHVIIDKQVIKRRYISW